MSTTTESETATAAVRAFCKRVDARITTRAELDRALPVRDLVGDLPADLEAAAAAIREFAERVDAGIITRDDRTELGGIITAVGERMAAFGIAVLA